MGQSLTGGWLGRGALAGLLSLGVLSTGALAHHGWGGYDATQNLTLTGTIREATYSNPHGTLQLETPEKTWLVILSPPLRMQNRGLTADMLAVGAMATVEGYPHKTNPIEMRAERITIDGRTTELR
jgi:Family of unknown function (DUF6152)